MKYIPILSILLWYSLQPAIAQSDVKGSEDHPLISRYPGSIIGYFEVKKYVKYDIAIGPETGYRKIESWIKAEGKLTRIYYTVKGERSLTEIYRNFQTAFKKGKFETLAEGIDEAGKARSAVGGRNFLGSLFKANPFPANGEIKILTGSATSGGTCYLAGKKSSTKGTSYVVISGAKYAVDENVFMVDIIEETAMEDNLIVINADALLKTLNESGKVALYAIYFDVDKSVIKDESKPSLDEIGKLLKNNPSLNLFVVGHTDMTGSFEHNMDLSKSRAEAIKEYLIRVHGIKSSRLTAYGIGPLSPISENKSEAGRTLNRRVELVSR